MGRIAEALKKAQQERAEKLRLHFREGAGQHASSTAVLDGPAERVSQKAATAGAGPSIAAVGVIAHDPDSAPRSTPRGLRSLLTAGLLAPTPRSGGSPAAPAFGSMPAWDVSPQVVALHHRNSSITEQYRAVRTWLLRRAITGEHSCLAVTSSVSKEGKTVTVANLAVVLAEVRHLKILAVDADFRHGHLAGLLKMPHSPGLAEVVAGRATLEEATRSTPLGNLFVVPAGACQGLSPAELVNSTALARVFEEFRERYDFVLVDTPPVQRLSDTGVIGALCAGILVVVRMNRTPAPLVQQSVRWLQSNNLNVVGCVATCCDASAAQPSYQDGLADSA
jgi:capsular exopolysaccharide synthesis family protein